MHPWGILEAEMIFPHHKEIIRLFDIKNCISQHFILENDYLNIYGIDINNHQDRYFTIGENKRQKFAFPLDEKEITVIIQVKNVVKGKFVTDNWIEAQISSEITLEMKEDLIEISFKYKEAFASDNEPFGPIKGHEVDIRLKVERPHPPLLRRPAYQDGFRAREEF
ncbi:hypothetical protein O181_000154 [Austropuccinia psidii MF-1]|uniref:Uncharacterized protein n=1 Tax=Austropuccinia psidii MF-1 TaxID=1389203 RepID=A0A9Q3B839_9BASI|nr:hypothetical protein [Austropuccinia psidii MF-1]